jgi:hypothetical protein
MKIQIAMVLGILSGSLSAATCDIQDTEELGDIGPDAELVCQQLIKLFGADMSISINNRRIISGNSVVIEVSRRPYQIVYQLEGSDWRVTDIR